jgi:hypothetical protein
MGGEFFSESDKSCPDSQQLRMLLAQFFDCCVRQSVETRQLVVNRDALRVFKMITEFAQRHEFQGDHLVRRICPWQSPQQAGDGWQVESVLLADFGQ